MINKIMQLKLYKNAIITEKLFKLTPAEKQKVVNKLLVGKTIRQLGKELGIPHSTIHDWRTLRQSNTEEGIHVSLLMIIRKLKKYRPTGSDDIQNLLRIKNIIELKLRESQK